MSDAPHPTGADGPTDPGGPTGHDGAGRPGAEPGVDPATAAAAQHGSFCPKMCTFSCPVTAATGRDDAVPWSFHRTVSDLASGRREPDASLAVALEACSGCLACREPCLFDQDVPAQVRAGRAAARRAGVAPAVVDRAVDRARRGDSPFDTTLPEPPRGAGAGDATVTVVTGCRRTGAAAAAALQLLRAAGERPAVVAPAGCCGAALEDLGAPDAAGDQRARLAERLPAGGEIVATDPHCLPVLRAASPGATVRDLPSALVGRLDADRLPLAGGPDRTVTYHDPCLLARAEDTVSAPRRLLDAAGVAVVEPEHRGRGTRCSGAGLAMGLLAPGAAEATARQRAVELADHGPTAVTACAGARRRLAAAGVTVRSLSGVLADHLPDTS